MTRPADREASSQVLQRQFPDHLGFLTVIATAAVGGAGGGGTGQTNGGSGDLAATGSGSTVPHTLAAIGATGLGVIVLIVARRLR